jgi:hypothetical protein
MAARSPSLEPRGTDNSARRWTVADVLNAFYVPVYDMARLLTATSVVDDLDPLELARDHDRWKWVCHQPYVFLTFFAQLHQLRRETQNGKYGDRALFADPDLVAACMHFYQTLDTAVLDVQPHLAGQYVHRLLFIEERLRLSRFRYDVMSKRADRSEKIRQAWEEGRYQQALALYFAAYMLDALPALAPPALQSVAVD